MGGPWEIRQRAKFAGSGGRRHGWMGRFVQSAHSCPFRDGNRPLSLPSDSPSSPPPPRPSPRHPPPPPDNSRLIAATPLSEAIPTASRLAT